MEAWSFLSFVVAFLRVWGGGILGVGEVVGGWVGCMVRGLALVIDNVFTKRKSVTNAF